MATFRKGFKKIVFGYATVEADSVAEAETKFDEGDFDEFDNKSEHEWVGSIE